MDFLRVIIHEMFKNYFKIAIRNLIKQKSWTFISLFSLVVGITCFMLLMLYALVDDLYGSLYKKEGDLGGIILSFSILTMITAAIGLYGLISFVVGKKTKEIGIRKILGASVFSVVGLILKQFFMPIAIAMMISLPIAYYFTHEWLEGFVYRIGLNVGLFAFSISIILIVSVLSIARQTIRAAIENPADSLKQE